MDYILSRHLEFGSYGYKGPSQTLLEITNAVMAAGKILPITPPATNASWNLQYYGPTLRCDHVNNTIYAHFQDNIAEALVQQYYDSLYGYISWLPSI